MDPKESQLVSEVVESLTSLYSTAAEDRPDRVLSGYPDASEIVDSQKILLDIMLPGRMSDWDQAQKDLGSFLNERLSEAWQRLAPQLKRAISFAKSEDFAGKYRGDSDATELYRDADPELEAKRILSEFFRSLPKVREMFIHDIQAAYDGDPAALNFAVVKLSYPGLLAIASHRLAHELYSLKVPLVPRVISEWVHSEVGVDINPGARIGKGFFIDHGTGVVVGETARIGENVKLYQGVTLGAKSFPLDEQGRPVKNIQRHPSVEDNVVVYANATILGGDTVIGKGSTVGGNVFLMESVPANSFVVSGNRETLIKTEKA